MSKRTAGRVLYTVMVLSLLVVANMLNCSPPAN